MKLTHDQIDLYHEQGFISIKGLFSADEIANMRIGYDAMWETSQDIIANLDTNDRVSKQVNGASYTFLNKKLRFVKWCSYSHPTLAGVKDDPRLLTIASQLLGSDDMEQLINQAHFKMPSDGQAFPWHKDSAHRGMSNGKFEDLNSKGSYVQSAIAIDDVTPENGPLGIIPGSNKTGHIDHVTSRTGGGTLPDGTYNEDDAIYPTPSAGDVLFFGPYTVHGSVPNNSDSARRIFINGYAYPGANKGTPGEMRRAPELSAV